jgi:pimeloyl-ACP methyl ester carboxylesterase
MPRLFDNARHLCLAGFALLFFGAPLLGQATPKDGARAARAEARSPVIVIGFVGGFVRRDDPAYGTVRLAERLRNEYPDGIVVRVFENHHEDRAYREVLRLLDSDRNGTLSAAEKRDARIIVYGHSWGGSETVRLARQLQRDGIPVLLTIQVDSVGKIGENDAVIPANVQQAANFYQPAGIIHGRSKIRAADPAATEILGNFRFDYGEHPLTCGQYPWHDRVFMKTHMEIDCDARVWNKVDSLIRSDLPVLQSASPVSAGWTPPDPPHQP